MNAEFEKAASHFEKMLNISLMAKDIVRIGMMKSILSWLTYFVQGKIDVAYQTSQEALQIAKESGDSYSNSFACGSHGISCFGKGFLEEAKDHFLKGVELSEKINQHFWNSNDNHFLGEIYFEIGEYKKAQDHYGKSIHFMERLEWLPSWVKLNKIALVRVKVMYNGGDIDLESLYSYVSENRVKQFEGLMQRYIGEILLNIDDQHISEAEHWIHKAIETDQRYRMMLNLGKDYALWADLFKRKGDRLKAQENLGKAIEIFKECGADGWVEKYEKEIAI